jgi:hypothetical protein
MAGTAGGNDPKLQAWRAHRQGLDGALAGASPAEVLEKSGWARSVGGVGPYLTLFARAGTSRAAADAAVAKLAIHELPSARGCAYVVPASDFALALAAGEGFDSELKVAEKLGVSAKEIDRLCDKILDALGSGPKDPEELREAAGGAVRNLGEAGKKKGLITTLPVALGRLQPAGEIRRIPVNGRLDQQRYKYALWRPNPRAKSKRAKEEIATELARRYFRWIGPASLAEFQWFSALGVKAAKEAVGPLKLVPFPGDESRWIFPRDLDDYRAFKPPGKPQIALVSSLDGISLLRRDLKGLLGPGDEKLEVFADKALTTLAGLADLPSHGIFDRGRLIGLWEFDVPGASLVWMSFDPKPGPDVVKAVRRTETFVKDELGDARSFSLDSPKSRTPRVEAIRKAGTTASRRA